MEVYLLLISTSLISNSFWEICCCIVMAFVNSLEEIIYKLLSIASLLAVVFLELYSVFYHKFLNPCQILIKHFNFG